MTVEQFDTFVGEVFLVYAALLAAIVVLRLVLAFLEQRRDRRIIEDAIRQMAVNGSAVIVVERRLSPAGARRLKMRVLDALQVYPSTLPPGGRPQGESLASTEHLSSRRDDHART